MANIQRSQADVTQPLHRPGVVATCLVWLFKTISVAPTSEGADTEYSAIVEGCIGQYCSRRCSCHTYFCLLGQDIKSDGFSIETCKIMVDMLDVSFNGPRSTEAGRV